jgi:hypothetical protein
MAGFNFSKVSVAITANTGGLARGLTRARNLLAKFGGVAARMPSLLGGIGATVNRLPSRLPLTIGFLALSHAVQLAYGAVRRVFGAVNAAVQSYASFIEQQNRVNVVFGESAAAVTRFAEAANAIGYADAQALQAAGTFGTLFKNVGATDAAAAEMSMSLVSLSADMASFNEVRIDDALRAMRSALVGEIEPIRRMGIMLNDAALRQEAFNMGLTDTLKRVLTPTQKMVAAYSSIIKQAKIQTGDFARTSGTLSNQQRKATSNIRDLVKEIGQKLEPTFRAVVTAFNEGIPSIRALGAVAMSVFSEFAISVGIAGKESEVFSGTLRMMGGAIIAVRGSVRLLYGAFLKFLEGSAAFGAGVYEYIAGFAENVIGGIPFIIEWVSGQLVSGLLEPVRLGLLGVAKISEYFGSKEFAKGVQRTAGIIQALQVQLAKTDPDVGAEFAKSISEPFKNIAEQGKRNAAVFGKQAAKAFEDGFSDVEAPFELFDEAKFRLSVGSVAKDMIPIAGEAGSAFSDWIDKLLESLNNRTGALSSVAKDLKAITVGSAAGEEFRNAILRGFDPRTAANTDKQIEENTRRGAAAAEAMPNAFGAIMADQFKLATVSV